MANGAAQVFTGEMKRAFPNATMWIGPQEWKPSCVGVGGKTTTKWAFSLEPVRFNHELRAGMGV